MRLTTMATTLSLALLSTIALAQSVTYDFDRTANFAALRTYAWTQGTSLPDALNHRRIVAAVDAQLAAKGMRMTTAAEHPDALVAYHASFERNLEINAFGTGWGPFGRSGSARAQEITVGTMAIEIVDARSRSIVWRGLASDDIDVNAKPEKREKNINRAAEKLFRNFPPKQ
jgi:hypothetical protein